MGVWDTVQIKSPLHFSATHALQDLELSSSAGDTWLSSGATYGPGSAPSRSCGLASAGPNQLFSAGPSGLISAGPSGLASAGHSGQVWGGPGGGTYGLSSVSSRTTGPSGLSNALNGVATGAATGPEGVAGMGEAGAGTTGVGTARMGAAGAGLRAAGAGVAQGLRSETPPCQDIAKVSEGGA